MPLFNENLEFCSDTRTTTGVDPSPETKALLDELRAWVSQERGRQAELARQLGVGRSTVNEWIKGESLPSWEAGRKLEQFLRKQRGRKLKQS
jgi:DNA-binding XRE family transcriptional regulator